MALSTAARHLAGLPAKGWPGYPERVDDCDPPLDLPPARPAPPAYALDAQIGYLLRRVSQRHLSIFAEAIPGLTTTQFAALARLAEMGPMSQNRLGRETAMDAATIKGVVDRLRAQGLVASAADPEDRRRLTVRLSAKGAALFDETRAQALEVSERTLAPLSAVEQSRLLALLARLV